MMCVARRCYCGVFGRLHQWADGNRRYQQGVRRSYSPPHCRKCGRARYGGDGVCQGQVDAQSGGCSRFQHREFCFTLLRFHHAITSSTSKLRSSSFRTLSPSSPGLSTVPCVLTFLANAGLSSHWGGYWASHSPSCLTLSSPSSCSFQVRSQLAHSPMLRFVTCDAVCSAHRQLHHARRQVELARRNDTDVYVFSHRLDRPWVVFVLTTRDNQASTSSSVSRFGITLVRRCLGSTWLRCMHHCW